MSQFDKKCRKPKKSQPQALQHQQSNVNQIDTTTAKSDDEESVNYINSYQQLYDQLYDENYDADSDDYIAAISSDAANQFNQLTQKFNTE